jgi:superoxide dismutase, Cu-Zn family
MLLRYFLAATVLLCASTAFGQMASPKAHADIINAQGQKIGTADFSQTDAGVAIKVDVSQLAPGTHGIHIHAVGKCEGPDFKSAGGHLNPDMKKHGTENPDGPHAGDMPNLEAGTDGQTHTTILAKGVSLGSGPNSLFHDGGTAIVIHEKADDYKTDPSGNSGNRIACGVVQK